MKAYNAMRAVLFMGLVFMLGSCGGGSGDGSGNSEPGLNPGAVDDPAMDTANLPRWILGPSTHRSSAAGTRQQSNSLTSRDGQPDYVVVAALTTGLQPENGAYAGSALTIQASAGVSGTYTVVEDSDFLITLANTPGSSIVSLSAIAGTQQVDPPVSSAWSSVSGTVEVLVDSEGVFHFSTPEPLLLTRSPGDVGGGIPESPDQIELTMFDVRASEAE